MSSRCVITNFKDVGLCPAADEVVLEPHAERFSSALVVEFSSVYGAIDDVARALARTHHRSLTAPTIILARNFSDAMDELLRHKNPMAQSDWGILSTAIQVAAGTLPFFFDLAASAVDHGSQGLWTTVATPVIHLATATAESARALGVSARDVADGKLQTLSVFKASEFLSTQVVVAGGLVCLTKGIGTGGRGGWDAATGIVPGGEAFATAQGGVIITTAETFATAGRTTPARGTGVLMMAGSGVDWEELNHFDDGSDPTVARIEPKSDPKRRHLVYTHDLDELAAALKSDRIDHQLIAVRRLGQLKTPEAVALLAKALEFRNPEVRQSVLIPTVDLGACTTEWRPKRIDIPANAVAQQAVAELLQIGRPEAVDAVMAAIHWGPPELEEMVVRWISETDSLEALLPKNAHFVPNVIRMLETGTPRAQQVAAITLGDIRTTGAERALITALQTDNNPTVQGLAATALGNYQSPAAIEALMGIVQASTEPSVVGNAAWALARHRRSPQVIEVLEQALTRAQDRHLPKMVRALEQVVRLVQYAPK